jgi:uncharacterized protein (TIGR02145 family)
MKTKPLLMTIVILTIAINIVAQETGTLTDLRDKKTYKTVKIGTQIWMAENLGYKATSGCYAYENNENNAKIYGYLYNWESAKKVCPSGWHLSSKDDWSALLTYLGGELIAGDKLKEAGTNHWQKPASAATNETGFTAIPGGYRNEKGEFYVLGYNCWWWCSTEEDTERASQVLIYGHTNDVTISYINKNNGFSVRCVKD